MMFSPGCFWEGLSASELCPFLNLPVLARSAPPIACLDDDDKASLASASGAFGGERRRLHLFLSCKWPQVRTWSTTEGEDTETEEDSEGDWLLFDKPLAQRHTSSDIQGGDECSEHCSDSRWDQTGLCCLVRPLAL